MNRIINKIVPALLLFLLAAIAANTCSGQNGQKRDFLIPIELTGEYENNIVIWQVEDSTIRFCIQADSDGVPLSYQVMAPSLMSWTHDSTTTTVVYSFIMGNDYSMSYDGSRANLEEPMITSIDFHVDFAGDSTWLEYVDYNGHISPPIHIIE